jgi:hypothetical protein
VSVSTLKRKQFYLILEGRGEGEGRKGKADKEKYRQSANMIPRFVWQ